MDPSICELHVGLKRFVALELVQRVGTTTKHKLVDHVTVAQWRQNVYIGRPVLLTTFIWIKAIQKSQFLKIPIPGVGIQLINILRLVFFLSMMACKPLTHTRTTPLAQASFPKWRNRKESIVTLRYRSEPIFLFCSLPCWSQGQ